MCPQSWEEKFKKYDVNLNMSLDTFVNIGNQLFPRAVFIDLRGFGETTILPYWHEVVDYLERFPFIEWHLVTNLSMPRDELWNKMIKVGFSLGFSCDGATRETFEFIRVRSHFDRIRHNLEVIRQSIKKYNRGFIYFISTIQKRNLHELRKLVELAHEFEVPEVQFKMVQTDDLSQSLSNGGDSEKIRVHVDSALDAAIDLGVRITFNDWIFTADIDSDKVKRAALPFTRKSEYPLPQSTPYAPNYWEEKGVSHILKKITDSSQVSINQKCFKPFSYTYINYEALMGTCNHMMYPNMKVMGDLKSQNVLDVWNGEKYRSFRQELITAKPSDPRCQWCFKHRLDD